MKQFISECEPNRDGTLILDGRDYAYLVRVRRMKVGDTLPVRLPVSGAAEMVIESISTAKKELRLKPSSHTQVQSAVSAGGHGTPAADVGSCCDGARSAEGSAGCSGCSGNAASLSDDADRATSTQAAYAAAALDASRIPPPSAHIILLQWVLKGAKTDTVVRQAAEAGVRAIVPVIGDFSVAKKQNPAQLERYRRIIREARQQSGSSVDTVILEPVPLADALNALPQFVPAHGAVFGMCSEVRGASVSVHTLLAAKPSAIVLAVGAEGGISDAEKALLEAAGFQTIHFNTNVLRAETAAVYAIAAAQTIINEADQWQLHEYTS